MKVLFLDDPDSLDGAEEHLQKHLDNLEMDIASSPKKALSKVKDTDYKVVAADYGLSSLG